jgi:hypothetical protein
MPEEIEIQISIKLTGDGFPSPEEMDARDQLEENIEEQSIGNVVHAGGGMGFMDLAVEVTDPTASLRALEKLISELGLTERTTLTVFHSNT